MSSDCNNATLLKKGTIMLFLTSFLCIIVSTFFVQVGNIMFKNCITQGRAKQSVNYRILSSITQGYSKIVIVFFFIYSKNSSPTIP